MRIGIMPQSCDETMGGIGVYTQEIIRTLLRVDSANEDILMYPGFGPRARAGASSIATKGDRNRDRIVPCALRNLLRLGGHMGAPRATKMRAPVPRETYWDQVGAPRVATRYGVDMVSNPHLTVPGLRATRRIRTGASQEDLHDRIGRHGGWAQRHAQVVGKGFDTGARPLDVRWE